MGANDAGAETVRDYLLALLRLVWERGEDAIKRPFGNSGWQYEVYGALLRAGIVDGRFDEDGYVEDVDVASAHHVIAEAISDLLGHADV